MNNEDDYIIRLKRICNHQKYILDETIKALGLNLDVHYGDMLGNLDEVIADAKKWREFNDNEED